MIAYHWDLIIQCIDVVKGLPIETWDTLPRQTKRASGLVGRWAIEKAFEAAILARGDPMPENRLLVTLCKASGVGLNSEQALFLNTVDREVTANEPGEADHMDVYLNCCWLARGIVQTVQQHMILCDILARKTDSKGKP